MKRVQVILTLKEPVAIGDGLLTSQNVRHSLGYIPGGVLRGALAQVALESLGKHHTSNRALPSTHLSESQFQELFCGASAVRFGFCYPSAYGAFPAPTTALACRDNPSHRYDTLQPIVQGNSWEMNCPACGGRLERERRYLYTHNGSWNAVAVPPKQQYRRVGISRLTGAVQSGTFFYTVEAILPVQSEGERGTLCPTQFSGTLTFTDEAQYTEFRNFLSALFPPADNGWELRIGSARARGFGRVQVSLQEPAPQPSVSELLERFQTRFGRPIFALIAHSPVIAFHGGRPAETLDPETLRAYLPALPSSVRLVPSATRVEREWVSGWSQAWGIHKPAYSALARGSVFAYEYDPAQQNELAHWLEQLLAYGIGERTAEGYGQFILCSDFHIDCAYSTDGGANR